MLIKEPHVQLSLPLDSIPTDLNLIDDGFDVELADQLARMEAFNKHLYRPNTYLHKWWARRCGTTFRAILKHLVRDESRRPYYTSGGLEGQIVLDPMMGGGTTLHEAIRLGANVIGADIDPIPVLQARATLTELPIHELEHHFTTFLSSLRSSLAPLYIATCPACGEVCEQRFMLYGVHRKCQCTEAILVDSYVLRHNADDSIVHICPESYNILVDNSVISRCVVHPGYPLFEKNHPPCTCGEAMLDLLDRPYFQRYVPIAVVGECSHHGHFFSAPQQSELDAISVANRCRGDISFDPRDFDIFAGPKSGDLVKRSITSYLDLFSGRQLLYLEHATKLVAQFEPVMRLKLAMLVSTSVEFNSMLCGYKGALKSRPGAIRHTFAHHAYSFPYTALENNPVNSSSSSGTLVNLFESRLVRGARWAKKPTERFISDGKTTQVTIRGEVDTGHECFSLDDLKQGTHRFMLLQGSSTRLGIPDQCVDHIVTDPPYFDSVQYSDLAAFFRVWLKQLLPAEANWHYALSDAAVDQQANGDGQYEAVLGGIFSECHRVLKRDTGRLVFTFHHWNPKGWAALTVALKNAGFHLVNRYVIHAENPTSVHIANQNALVHDVVLVLASKEAQERAGWALPDSVDKISSQKFCQDCGTVLGYMLDCDLIDEEIRALWTRLLG